MIKVIILGLLSFFLTACNEVPTYQDPEDVHYSIISDNEITKDIEEAVRVIEDNLRYAEVKDMDGYLSTIVSSAHEETREELAPFFEEYDLDHTILSVEVLRNEDDSLLIQTKQQTVMIDSIAGVEPYRDHIAEANHTLIRENGEWKIKETYMTNTVFLEYDY